MVNFLQPFGNTELTYPLGGGGTSGGDINVAFVVDASLSMYGPQGLGLPEDWGADPLVALGDLDGDGVDGTFADIAYYAIENFIPEITAFAGSRTVRIRLIAFSTANVAETVSQTYSGPSDLTTWAGAIFSAGTAGASLPALGTAAALTWFGTVGATTSDTNRIILLGDGDWDTTGLATDIASFTATYAGTVHARQTLTLVEVPSPGTATMEAFNSDSVTSADADFGFFIFDQPRADNALRVAEILG